MLAEVDTQSVVNAVEQLSDFSRLTSGWHSAMLCFRWKPSETDPNHRTMHEAAIEGTTKTAANVRVLVFSFDEDAEAACGFLTRLGKHLAIGPDLELFEILTDAQELSEAGIPKSSVVKLFFSSRLA